MNLYYLNSRYYDSVVGRFISSDDPIYLGASGDMNSYNLYAYCSNNPIICIDPSGNCSRFLGFLWKIDCKNQSCPDSKEYKRPEPKNTDHLDDLFSYKYGGGEKTISLSITINKYNIDDAHIIELTHEIANKMESTYYEQFNGAKIDRAQLYGEIKLHVDLYNNGIMRSNANPIDIDIRYNGIVKDNRWLVNFISSIYANYWER